MKKYSLLVLLIILLPSISYQQSLIVKYADKKFNSFEYVKAIESYEYALKRDSSDIYVLHKLIESYKKTLNNNKADTIYQKLIINKDSKPIDILSYANFLTYIGDYTKSVSMYNKYLLYDANNGYIKALVKYISAKKKSLDTEILCKVDCCSFNSIYSDFAPALLNNKLVFTSARPVKGYRQQKYAWDNQYFLNLFYVNIQDSSHKVKQFSRSINSKYHDGVVSFSADKKHVFFTRNTSSDNILGKCYKNIANLNIISASREKNKWSICDDFPFNSDLYSTGHPSITHSGNRIYFVSDKPGGYGNTDIYYCDKNKDGTWQSPINLGSAVNTSGKEMFPYISKDNYLFFSSDGHLGMGGLDLYCVNMNNQKLEISHWGKPINSRYDDFSILIDSLNSQKAYFSSNRINGVGKDDIYTFKFEKANKVKIVVKDEFSSQILKIDSIYVGQEIHKYIKADTEGINFIIARNKKYNINIKHKQYIDLNTYVKSDLYDACKNITLFMTKKPELIEAYKIPPDFMKSLYFDFDKYKITDADNKSLDYIYGIMTKYPKSKLCISANADVKGSSVYNHTLANKRAKSVIMKLVSLGANIDNIEITILGEERLLERRPKQTDHMWRATCRRVDMFFR